MIYGALQAGGTKMVLSILNEKADMLQRWSIPTETPQVTMPRMIDFFKSYDLASLGVACFGPLELNPKSKTYGSITATPKLAWRDYPIRKVFADALRIPVGIDTDVNAAAWAEYQLGAARGKQSCLYVTIGTGIGGGLVMNGQRVHGLVHPELGHQLMLPAEEDPKPEGFCPYHKHCLQGVASGPAIEKRWGVSPRELPRNHAAWRVEGDYLAQMCHNAIMSFSPEKIILGGGVMQQSFLLNMVRFRTVQLLGGYICSPVVDHDLRDYIVAPGCGQNSGVLGAWLLAKEVLT